MRALATCIALLLATACTAPSGVVVPVATASPTHEPGTIAVTALLDLSGTRAPKGDAQRTAMQQWVGQQRAGSPQVRLKIVDLAGSDARLVLELRHVAETGDADAVVIGAPALLDEVLVGVIGLVRRPVLFTLPLAEPPGSAADAEGRRWVFALAPSPEQAARVAVSALPARATPTIIVADGSLQAGREQLAIESELRRDARAAPAVMTAGPEQRDSFAQRLRAVAPAGSAIFFAGAAAPYLSPQRLVPAADGTTPAVTFLSYLTDAADAGRLGDAAPAVRWPGLRAAIATPGGTHAATAADAMAILAAAGSTGSEPDRLRQRIEGDTFAGIATTYAFGPSRHVGADQRDLVLLAWEGGRITLARPIGAK